MDVRSISFQVLFPVQPFANGYWKWAGNEAKWLPNEWHIKQQAFSYIISELRHSMPCIGTSIRTS